MDWPRDLREYFLKQVTIAICIKRAEGSIDLQVKRLGERKLYKERPCGDREYDAFQKLKVNQELY